MLHTIGNNIFFFILKPRVKKRSVKVKIKDGYYQVSIPIKEALEDENFRCFLDLQQAEEIISRSNATEKDIAELSEKVDKENWEKNKEWFLRGLSD